MLNRRFHLNSFPLGIILNLLSTISFSDFVNKLDDELDIKNEDEESELFFFSCLVLDFFRLFLLDRFTIIYCIEYIFLDNISCSLPDVRAPPFRFANKLERGLRIGLHAG